MGWENYYSFFSPNYDSNYHMRKLFYLDEEKIEFALGNREFCFLAGQQSQECFFFYISNIGIHDIYLSLTLGAAKFKKLD